jgi:hypothetical protein
MDWETIFKQPEEFKFAKEIYEQIKRDFPDDVKMEKTYSGLYMVLISKKRWEFCFGE